jgi:hypothetical protein
VLANAWLIFRPQCFQKFLSGRRRATPENSNNPLAVNPKAKMMRPLEFFCNFTRLKRRLPATKKDLFK